MLIELTLLFGYLYSREDRESCRKYPGILRMRCFNVMFTSLISLTTLLQILHGGFMCSAVRTQGFKRWAVLRTAVKSQYSAMLTTVIHDEPSTRLPILPNYVSRFQSICIRSAPSSSTQISITSHQLRCVTF